MNKKLHPKVSYAALATIAGIITIIAGLLVLIGWYFDIGILKTLLPGAVPMRANAAALFLLTGLALILLQRSTPLANILVRFCALVIALVGLLTLSQTLFGWNLGMDEVLYRAPEGSVSPQHPVRMSPDSAFNFALLGVAFWLLTLRRLRLFLLQFLAVFTISVGLFWFVSYVTDIVDLTGPAEYLRMTFYGSGTFIVLCVGMLITSYGRSREPVTIEHGLLAALTVIAVVAIIISSLSITGFRSLIKASERVDLTQRVEDKLDGLLSHVLMIQTCTRNYILTGDENYSNEMTDAARTLPGLLEELRLLTTEDTHQQNVLVAIEGVLKEQIGFYEQIVRARKTGETEALSLLKTTKGLILTDSIRDYINQMAGKENRLLQKMSADESKQAERTERIIYFSLVGQLLLLAFIFVVLKRDLTGRRKAEMILRESEEMLKKVNEELEQRVADRTAELKRTYKVLLESEENLRKKEEHHRAVIENIFKFVPEGLLVFTRNLNLMKQNKAFEEIVRKYAERLGYTEEELAEKIIEQLRGRITAGDTTEIHIPGKDQ